MLRSPKRYAIIVIAIKSGRRKPLPPIRETKKVFYVNFLHATFSALSSYISVDDGHEKTDADSQEQAPPFWPSFLQEFQNTLIFQSIPFKRLPCLERGRGSLSKNKGRAAQSRQEIGLHLKNGCVDQRPIA
jgi:hypothetical protein